MTVTPRPEAVMRLRLDRPGWLEASAGSGKTYAIEHLVARLLRETPQLALPQILLVTFTEKAAGELKEKLRRRLASEIQDADLAAPDRLRLQEAWLHFDRAGVHTIHGFCLQALGRYAFELGGLFKSELADERFLREQALLELQRDAAAGNLPEPLQSAMLHVTAAFSREKLLEAAADFKPERGDTLWPALDWDAVETSESAARTAIQDLRALLVPDEAPGLDALPWYQALSGYALSKRLKTKILTPSRLNAFEILFATLSRKDTDFASQARALSPGKGLLTKAPEKIFTVEVEAPLPDALAAWLNRASRHVVAAAHAIAAWKMARKSHGHALFSIALKSLAETIARVKAEKGKITYDDMALRLWQALQASPELATLLRRQYPVAIVDEFQDTDPVQWAIFETLYLAESAPRPLYLVGDPKQAIYGFRGGDLATYLRARSRLHALSAKGQALGLGLESNYRSRRELIEACNAVFSQTGWFRTDTSGLRSPHWDLPAQGDDITFTPARFGNAARQFCDDTTLHPQPVVLLKAPTAPDGAAPDRGAVGEILNQAMAWHVADLLRHPQRLMLPDGDDRRRPVNAGDICILMRAHKDRLGLETWFRKLGIPYHVYKQRGLFRSPEAGHLSVVLEALAHPGDRDAQWAAHWSELLPPHPAQDLMHPFLRELLPLAHQGRWPQLLHQLVHGGSLRQRLGPGHGAETQWSRYQHLIQSIGHEALTQGLDILALSDRFSEWRRRETFDDTEGSSDAQRATGSMPKVTFLTMHASKGLEFPVVFVAGGVTSGKPGKAKKRQHEGMGWDWMLPLSKSLRKDLGLDADESLRAEAIAEDKRLLYVALTRAQYKLYLPMPGEIPSRPQDIPPAFAGFASQALRAAAQQRASLFAVHDLGVTLELPTRLPAASVTFESASPKTAAPTFEDAESPDQAPEDLAGRRRRLASYSQLALRRKQMLLDEAGKRVEPDEIEAGMTETAPPVSPRAASQVSPNFASLPRGAGTGNLLHACLERIDFAWARQPLAAFAEGPAREVMQAQLKAHGLGEEWLPATAALLHRALTTPMTDPAGDPGNGPSLRLAEVTYRLPELEFMLPFGSGRPIPDVRSAGGYLWGYIDLVFRHRERYYLLDWKSNSLDAYDPEAIARSMQEEAYDLQGRLYALALHRWLKHRLTGYDPGLHFGGVLYLYLRGMSPDSTDGVRVWRPTPEDLMTHYPRYVAACLGNREPL